MQRPAIHASTHLIGALLFTLTPHALAQADPIPTPIPINDAPSKTIEHTPAFAHLAHLPKGEWRTEIANGTQQRDVWIWGPSKHALTSITSKSDATVYNATTLRKQYPSSKSFINQQPCAQAWSLIFSTTSIRTHTINLL
jgi:hypothetical protein